MVVIRGGMAEALADALILFFERQDALERAFNEWQRTIEWQDSPETPGKREPKEEADRELLAEWIKKEKELKDKKPKVKE
jgi:lipopolysaccharide biosynthesis protein